MEDPLALDYSIKKLGADNVLWAIDYPYQPSAPAVKFMDCAPISEADRAKLTALFGHLTGIGLDSHQGPGATRCAARRCRSRWARRT